MTAEQESQAQFEIWWRERGLGGYDVQLEAWQASRAAAPVELPEPWGVSVGGRIWVGKAPAHVHKLAEQEGLTIQKLYTEQQMHAMHPGHSTLQTADGCSTSNGETP